MNCECDLPQFIILLITDHDEKCPARALISKFYAQLEANDGRSESSPLARIC